MQVAGGETILQTNVEAQFKVDTYYANDCYKNSFHHNKDYDACFLLFSFDTGQYVQTSPLYPVQEWVSRNGSKSLFLTDRKEDGGKRITYGVKIVSRL